MQPRAAAATTISTINRLLALTPSYAAPIPRDQTLVIVTSILVLQRPHASGRCPSRRACRVGGGGGGGGRRLIRRRRNSFQLNQTKLN